MARKAKITRKTKETDIVLSLNLDGQGNARVKTGFGFLDHMLQLFSRFAEMDLMVKARGDIEVDEHHLVEDTGLCLGLALKEALADRKGVERFGFASVPMDEVLVQVSLDISGRPGLYFRVPVLRGREGSFDTENVQEFLKGLVNQAGLTLHVQLVSGENLHHVNEAIFKALAVALRQAVRKTRKG
ncbi:MAG TPA: imidazoleglycerol-phosphate dehydratase HisB, partial [bacterium]|nr:imidazoleglycerol-phosphate dehydratase HisB [bacterium]